jgi:hypothetical protein
MVLLLLFVFGSFCFGQNYVPSPNEELYGTWTNEQNSGDIYHPQKMVVTPDRYTLYYKISDSVPCMDNTWRIVSKWTDSEGNVWYKIFGGGIGNWEGHNWLELDKLSKSGTVWERALSPVRDFDPRFYPREIDPNHPYYRILYRAGK